VLVNIDFHPVDAGFVPNDLLRLLFIAFDQRGYTPVNGRDNQRGHIQQLLPEFV
jgi:hypothetical protein